MHVLKSSAGDLPFDILCRATLAFCAEYHDLALFQEPHKGQADVRAFFEKVTRTLPRDLNFAVDAISDGNPGATYANRAAIDAQAEAVQQALLVLHCLS